MDSNPSTDKHNDLPFPEYYQLGVIAQLGERFAGSEEVRGSIPLDSTKTCKLKRQRCRFFCFDSTCVDLPNPLGQKLRGYAAPQYRFGEMFGSRYYH